MNSAVFAQMTTECPYTSYTLQWAAFSPIQIAPFHEGYGPPSNTWFLWLTRVHNPNDISIGSAIFAWLTSVTNRLIDQQTGQETALLSL